MDQQRKHDLCLYLVKRLMKERLDNGGYITQALLDIVPAKEEMDRASTNQLWLAFRALVNMREPGAPTLTCLLHKMNYFKE